MTTLKDEHATELSRGLFLNLQWLLDVVQDMSPEVSSLELEQCLESVGNQLAVMRLVLRSPCRNCTHYVPIPRKRLRGEETLGCELADRGPRKGDPMLHPMIPKWAVRECLAGYTEGFCGGFTVKEA